MFERGGGDREPAEEFSDCSGDCGAAFDRHVFFAGAVFAGGAGKLGKVEYGLSADGGSADRRKRAWIRADGGGDAEQRFTVKCHGFDEHADAVFDGGGWLFTAGVCREAPEIRHAVDRDSDFVGDLRAASVSHAGAVAHGVYLAAEPGDRADGVGRMETEEDAAGDAPAVSYSLGKCGAGLCGDRADSDDHCG